MIYKQAFKAPSVHENMRQCRGADEPSLEAEVLLDIVSLQVIISAAPQQMLCEFGFILRLMTR